MAEINLLRSLIFFRFSLKKATKCFRGVSGFVGEIYFGEKVGMARLESSRFAQRWLSHVGKIAANAWSPVMFNDIEFQCLIADLCSVLTKSFPQSTFGRKDSL